MSRYHSRRDGNELPAFHIVRCAWLELEICLISVE
ncbi:Uncharacterized protein BM_BM1339 [Brugia malayi]|uniref:Bm1339 n=1 Tax=Brugia malayi TaxID=6279 RepID=A0A1U7F150_BRUMA|nr:Uncharacterized protein BM_BM1339 [Brugia malayi]CDP96271.1 Bm1339 [Brugia malayi]VIO98462.1 Uncharacterized protein BM_BM1339 [Brugia malayi]